MATSTSSRPDGSVTFVDFTPSVLDPGPKYSTPRYESFRSVVERANEWLSRHPEVKVQTCESIDLPLLNEVNKQLKLYITGSVFYEPISKYCNHIIFLRLWFLPRASSEKACQQIGYIDQLPVCTKPGGTFSLPEFETLGETMGKLNEKLRADPLPGRVINIETQNVAFYKYKDAVDSEKTCWSKFAKKSCHFLAYIRVYYLLGEIAYEELGCADFVPECLKEPKTLTLGEYESLDTVIQHAKEWIYQNSTIRVINGQTVKYPATKIEKYKVDPQCTFLYELGSQMTRYVKVLRIYYTQPMQGHDLETPSGTKEPLVLTSKAFTPAQLTFGGKFKCAKFEDMQPFVERIQAWCKLTDLKILCMETSLLDKHSEEKLITLDPNSSSCYVLGSKMTRYVVTVRVYFDGTFSEPPEELLPTLPEVTKDGGGDCCVS